MPKHIGIVGVSAEGAALCYRTVCVEGASIFGRHAHPEVTLHTYPLSDYMRHIDAGRWKDVASMLLDSAEKLRLAGADLLICPDNTAHEAIDLIRDQSSLPWLHIAEEVAAKAAERNFRQLLILGTKYLMEGPVYPAKLRSRAIEWEIPPPDERQHINTLIFDELVYGRYEESARSYFNQVIARSKRRGTDAAVLGCTEIPLLMGDTTSPLPTLDSTRILARAALREAVREEVPNAQLERTR
jgi:aspartate racemase